MSEQNDMTADERYCFNCIHNEVCRYCPHDGCDFKEILKVAKPDTELLREVLPILRWAFFANFRHQERCDEVYDKIKKAVRDNDETN